MSARFRVVTVRGFPFSMANRRAGGKTREGLTASVVDTFYGTEHGSFASETLLARGGLGNRGRLGHEGALAAAERLCAELNEWDEREGSEPLPPFGMLGA